ncbi:MAG: hypothetical protein LW832_07320 [Parachlamydia sp.]|jgi:hypothetical protein|nr:hypothetical protein [Parachlamydia sp.]
MTFISFHFEIKEQVTIIVKNPFLHARWLNTLSYLENCGARKIAACEHPTLVKEEMLKHASEEFRHAFYLKKQIKKVYHHLPTYGRPYLLGGRAAYHYLNLLDLQAARYLKKTGFSKEGVKAAAYLLVTYAIERRARELYPLYEEALREAGLPIFVKSIILEEEEHYIEMEKGIGRMNCGAIYADAVCSIESLLCKNWIDALAKQAESDSPHGQPNDCIDDFPCQRMGKQRS